MVNEASAATPSGAGKVVGPDSFLTLHYRIALENDTDIVTTFDDKPATLLLGQGQMAPTLEQA
ncbi:hypothetical protein KC218_28295, partial [Mycobacterium tuberculosis]|nr:hypothetical protein [Mycobacterium tuberculosis]